MLKKLEMVVKRFSLVILINVIVFSFSQQILPLANYNILITNAKAEPVTDLTLGFSTFLGGSDWDFIYDIAVTDDGSCYVTGLTESNDFPTKNAFDNSYGGYGDVFVSKFSSDGSLLWSTFLGGSDGEYATGIAVTVEGSCYVTGTTFSDDFPMQNAFDSTYNGTDAFLAKFAADGQLLWSTYLGGSESDFGESITIAKDDICYVIGITNSDDFPLKNAYDNSLDGLYDIFISKFSSDGSLLWSTYLGGSDYDSGQCVSVTTNDSFYVTGFTLSTDFPVQNAYNSIFGGIFDVFVSKFDANGSLLWSTFLGGSNIDIGYDIAIKSDGSCYVTGETESFNFPMKNAYDNSLNGHDDIFIAKFSIDGFLLFSTYLGGSDSEHAFGIAVTLDGRYYVTGYTESSDFPIQNAFDNTQEMYEGFVTVIIEPRPSTEIKILYGILAFFFVTLLIVVILFMKRK